MLNINAEVLKTLNKLCIRQVAVLCSNNCMGIGLGRLRIGCLKQVVIL